ncbi:threonine ammonia-lyase IlvA, partial [Aerococcus sp. L_4]
AFACNEKQVMATIYMPNTTPAQKINQVKYFGGDYVNIVIEGDTFDECSQAAHEYGAENQMTFIEPYDDENVIAGQGSLAVEIHQSLTADGETADYVLVPIGGGGLISGVSAYVREAMPETKIVGVEPAGAASMKLALDQGQPTALAKVNKFADGTAVGKVGDITFQYAKDNIDRIETVEEGKIAGTIIDLYTKQAIVAEPSGALTVSALDNMAEDLVGKTVVCIISGGNNDINRMAEIEEKALIYSGTKQYFVVNFPQRPGALREFVTDVLGPDDDIAKFEYTKKISRSNGPALVGILLGDYETLPGLLDRLKNFDANYISVSENPTLYEFLV